MKVKDNIKPKKKIKTKLKNNKNKEYKKMC